VVACRHPFGHTHGRAKPNVYACVWVYIDNVCTHVRLREGWWGGGRVTFYVLSGWPLRIPTDTRLRRLRPRIAHIVVTYYTVIECIFSLSKVLVI